MKAVTNCLRPSANLKKNWAPNHSLKKEAKRLAEGLSLEPPTFYHDNPAAAALKLSVQ